MDKDFSQIQLKMNSSGSWSNVLRCDGSREQEVKQACETLIKASDCRLRFKLVDSEGGELSYIGPPEYRWKTR